MFRYLGFVYFVVLLFGCVYVGFFRIYILGRGKGREEVCFFFLGNIIFVFLVVFVFVVLFVFEFIFIYEFVFVLRIY